MIEFFIWFNTKKLIDFKRMFMDKIAVLLFSFLKCDFDSFALVSEDLILQTSCSRNTLIRTACYCT